MKREDLERLAERSLKYLHGEAGDHAQARAEHDYLQAWVKSEKSRIKSSFTGLSNVAAEDEALKSPAYIAALQAARAASETWYEIQFKREAASAAIDAWRTACSNERAFAG